MSTEIGVILEAAFAVGIIASMGKRLLLGKIPWLGAPTEMNVCHNRQNCAASSLSLSWVVDPVFFGGNSQLIQRS